MTKAERFAELQRMRAASLAARVGDLLGARRFERALDVGTGTGALAYALAGHAREVVALDRDPELAGRARAGAPQNVEVVVGDAEVLPFEGASFDLGATLRTLHHTPRPGRVIAELARVTRPGGSVLVADQIAPDDLDDALALNRFERARDPSTSRVLGLEELCAWFDAEGLVIRRQVLVRELRAVGPYLDLAGCEGAERERVHALAPVPYEATLGWFYLDAGGGAPA